MSLRPKKSHSLMAGAVLVVVLTFCAFRIYQVNAQAYHVPVQEYEIGQEIDLSGSFLEGKDLDAPDGYSITVRDAKLFNYSDFMECMVDKTKDISEVPAGQQGSILALRVHIKNENNTEGYISGGLMHVLSGDRSEAYILSSELLTLYEKFKEYQTVIQIRPNTEYELWLPCVQNIGPQSPQEGVIKGKEFHMIVSAQPIKKEIRIVLP